HGGLAGEAERTDGPLLGAGIGLPRRPAVEAPPDAVTARSGQDHPRPERIEGEREDAPPQPRGDQPPGPTAVGREVDVPGWCADQQPLAVAWIDGEGEQRGL